MLTLGFVKGTGGYVVFTKGKIQLNYQIVVTRLSQA